MKPLYAKVLLYSQKAIEAKLEKIDQLVLNKALASMGIYKSCLILCEEIIKLTRKKDFYLDLYSVIERAIDRLNDKEKELIRYKYYYNDLQKENSGILGNTREYFRRQVAVLTKLGQIFEYLGVTDQKFEKYYLANGYIRNVYNQVVKNEIMHSKVSKREKKRRLKEQLD